MNQNRTSHTCGVTTFVRRILYVAGWVLISLGLQACSSQPPVPDWEIKASDAAQRAMAAHLEGNLRVAEQEWRNAHSEVSKTGQPALWARVALMRCAVRVASLDWDTCEAYEAVAQDATPQDAAYARYLYGGVLATDIAVLPAVHQTVAQSIVSGCAQTATALHAMKDPRAQLIAAAAAMRAQCVTPEQAWPSVDAAATTQGWRYPLMAWMVLVQKRLHQAGQVAEAEQLERRLRVLQGQLPVTQSPSVQKVK